MKSCRNEISKRDDEMAELDERAEAIQTELRQIQEGKLIKAMEPMSEAEADEFGCTPHAGRGTGRGGRH